MTLSDADAVVLAANPAYDALYGFAPDQVLGHSFAIIFPAAERAVAEQLDPSTALATDGTPGPQRDAERSNASGGAAW